MPQVAVAFSNNDIAVVAWTFDRHLDGCLGFAIHQIDIDNNSKETILPAMARFAGQTGADLTTAQAPIQKFWWKDLYAKRGGSYEYLIVPMGGTPGQTLTPLAGVQPLRSNRVTLTPDRAPFEVYFNRGIVATQALAHALGDHPSVDALTPHIQNPADPIRINLMGQLQDGVTSLLSRADKNGGTIHAALYELNDPQGLEKQLHDSARSLNVILGNEVGPKSDDADAANRAALKAAGANVIDRILGKGDIPHNKFMVLTENNQPTAVLSGSTNWTSTGLCTQANNALVIESKDVAQHYIDYWNALKADTDAAGGDQHKLQSPTLRTSDHGNNDKAIAGPIDLGGGVKVEVMLSPNTPGKLGKNPDKPNDMGRVFELMDGAKQAILFLAFDPGNNSILDEAGSLLRQKPDLFVRGALTNAQRATNFSEALHAGGSAEADDAAAPAEHTRGAGTVTVVGDKGQPKKQGEANDIDFRAIPAGAVTAKDAPGGWEAELAKYGFAIIHSKIVVIDPFSDDCVVVAGSHNLGYRASHNNDENMVIIHGHRGLAEAYACNVLDVYDHYAWRFLLKEHPNQFGKPLEGDDKWQERYITGPAVKSAEMRFWLAAGGQAPSSPATGASKQPVVSNAPPTAPEAPVAQAPVVQPAKAKTKAKTAKPAAKPAAKKAAAKSSAGKAAKKSAKKAVKKAAKKAVKASKGSKKAAKKAGKAPAESAGKKAAKAWVGNKAAGKKAAKKKAGKKKR